MGLIYGNTFLTESFKQVSKDEINKWMDSNGKLRKDLSKEEFKEFLAWQKSLGGSVPNPNNLLLDHIIPDIKRLVKKYNNDTKIQKEIDKEYDKCIKQGSISDKKESAKLICEFKTVKEKEIEICLHKGSDVMVNNILVSTFNKFVSELKNKYKHRIKSIEEDNGILYITIK